MRASLGTTILFGSSTPPPVSLSLTLVLLVMILLESTMYLRGVVLLGWSHPVDWMEEKDDFSGTNQLEVLG